MAEHDPLTDLPNRILFESHVRVTLAVAQREHGRFALLLVDLDRFKAVNDSMGHRVGDLLLQEVARRLLQAVRESDTPARIGGDEFVVLLRTIRRPDDAMTVAEKVRTLLAEPFIIEGSAVAISASIGIALYPEHGVNAVELLRNADAAMYRAKEHGRNAVAFSTPVE